MGDHSELPVYSLFVHPNDLRGMLRDPEQEEAFQGRLKVGRQAYRIMIALRGAYIRRYPKKSFSVQFLSPNSFQAARELHLNAEYADPSMIRNKLSFDFFQRIGALAPHAHFVKLLLNGGSAGLYLQLESVDDLYLKKRNLPPGAIFYAINDDANFSLLRSNSNRLKDELEEGYEGKVSTEADWESLRELLYVINTTPQADFPNAIDQLVDIEQYFNWLAGVVCTHNFDGFIQNYALYRNGDTGRFQPIPWDYDGTWGRNLRGERLRADYIPITGYNSLTARLLAVPKFRVRYKRRMEEVLETEFTADRLTPLIENLLQTVRPALLDDPHRKEFISRFDGEFEVILKFINERSRYLFDHLVDLN
ncbi:CotH kinase family protein [Tumebacillus sp. ITR2]|uniref:CotH kinase family protein n=1 Tax=Tumebacillus amylolyticus TaxID=2801339 RepID=A0ABS1JD96_9BACL|nr:CotH kinase family protein [Tumebacillus amylolyticus]MBL0388262.1 CotH kinase family protein [Tumebacillus amylolyticus]